MNGIHTSGNPKAQRVAQIARWIMIAGVPVGLAPLVIAFIAGGIADMNQCVLNEAGAHPCVIGGHDYGELLADMFVSFWLVFFTLPAGFWMVLIGFIVRRLALRKVRATDAA